MNKIALITGITGQDGSFLAEFLLEKGYEVHGIIRRSSSFNTGRIEHLYLDTAIEDMHKDRKVKLHYGDLTDSESLIRLIREIKPTEIYNLGAQSHVQVSFDAAEYTGDVDLIIVPGVAFDRKLHRLGRGGGYYDRFLRQYKKAAHVAVAYDFQIVKEVPSSWFDRRVTCIVTEKEVIR